MPIYWFALLVSVLISASANASPFEFERPLWVVVGCVLLWGLLAKGLAIAWARRVLMHKSDINHARDGLARHLNALRWTWLPLGAMVPTLGGYGFLIQDSAVGWSVAISGVLLMLPSLAAVASTWYAQYQFNDWAADPIPADLQSQAELRSSSPRGESALAMMWRLFRMQAAWVLAPVLLVLACIDLGNAVMAPWGMKHDIVGGVIGLLSLPLFLPLLVQTMWSSTPCDCHDETAWLNDLVSALGYRNIRVRIWNTDHRVSTAVVAGFVPGFRTLLLSDGLLERLDRKSIAMVVMHELAHVARGHILIRMFTLVPTWAIAGWISFFVAGSATSSSLCMGLSVLLTLLVMRFVSHATEWDADRFAVRMSQRVDRNGLSHQVASCIPDTQSEAAFVLAQALVTLCGDNPQTSRATWMHPSLASRVDRLRDTTLRAKALRYRPSEQ